MKKLFFIVLLCFGTYCYFGYHFIVFNSSIKILRKAEMSYVDTFVDARGAKALTIMLKPSLIRAGIKDLVKKEGITVKVQ